MGGGTVHARAFPFHNLQVEHSRHRRVAAFLVNLVAGRSRTPTRAKTVTPIRLPNNETLPACIL